MMLLTCVQMSKHVDHVVAIVSKQNVTLSKTVLTCQLVHFWSQV